VEDRVDLAIDELFDIEYPSKKDSKSEEEVQSFGKKITGDNVAEWGEWVYYPWLNKAVHFPSKQELRALRTSRNRNLVTQEEQLKLYKATLLVLGLSVGSNIVEALVSQGIGGKLLLVDMDVIEPSNLNRIRSPYHQVGLSKVEAISRKVWEIDPYIEIRQFSDGLTEKNLIEILNSNTVDVVIDEMDDLRMKILLREVAKARHIPVVMAADDGDNSLLEIERYDRQPELEPFSGRIPQEVLKRIKAGNLPRAELGVMIGRYFVGPEYIPLRMYESLGEVGKTLPSWPQLGSAAALSGLGVAYAVKKILLGQKVKEGRTLLSLDATLDLEQADETHQEKLKQFRLRMTEGEKQHV
jgi:hypothetical protein